MMGEIRGGGIVIVRGKEEEDPEQK